MNLDITISDSGHWSVVAVSGDVDLASAPALRRSFEENYADGASLVADLTNVKFMDSTGLRVIIAAHQDLEELGGRLAVVPGEGVVARLFDLTGVDERLNVYESVLAATTGS